MCIETEALLFNKFKTVKNSDYLSDFKYRLMMLKDRTNPELKKRVLTRQVTPKFFIHCRIADLASDKTKKELKIMR